jgi:hypothetical protein
MTRIPQALPRPLFRASLHAASLPPNHILSTAIFRGMVAGQWGAWARHLRTARTTSDRLIKGAEQSARLIDPHFAIPGHAPTIRVCIAAGR